MIRRLVIAIWSAALAAALTAPALAAQPPTGQSEFLPMKDLPPTEQIPAAPLLVAGYAFIWVAVAVYVWTIWRRLNRVEAEMRTLAQKTQRR
ncbi:MAG TPA: CcmD family protein [Vicinamibacterales bacterium]|nr:CcmD family protein [Vicinamibacterales bacterium]